MPVPSLVSLPPSDLVSISQPPLLAKVIDMSMLFILQLTHTAISGEGDEYSGAGFLAMSGIFPM